MTFLCLYISRWWRQTWDTAPYFTVVNQSEARISTEHGISFDIETLISETHQFWNPCQRQRCLSGNPLETTCTVSLFPTTTWSVLNCIMFASHLDKMGFTNFIDIIHVLLCFVVAMYPYFCFLLDVINRLVQERRNSSALAMKLHFSCTNRS